MIFIETLSFRVKTDTPSRVKLDKVAGRTFHTSAVRVGEAGHFFDSNLSHAFISLPGREGAHDLSQLTKNPSAGKPDSALPVAQSSPFPRETRAQDRLYPHPFSQGSHSHHQAGAHPLRFGHTRFSVAIPDSTLPLHSDSIHSCCFLVAVLTPLLARIARELRGQALSLRCH